ncbi:MAG: RNA polymerase factor sigma-54 [Rhizobiales bacterium]|nr:RNA polymerase factor sigma-54 [Hyphomicrobiales bacterium]
MAISQKLQIRQSQGLVMTPQLQQAIKLLQFSHLELSSYVESEIERNPLLETDDNPEGGAERRQESGNEQAAADENSPGTNSEGSGEDVATLRLDGADSNATTTLDSDYDNDFSDDTPATSQPQATEFQDSGWANMGAGSPGGFDTRDFDSQSQLTAEKTLHEHLSDQMHLVIFDPAERLIAQHLIDGVDDTGYMRLNIDNLAERLGAPATMIKETLGTLQAFDPPGICARDLAECLTIQLREKDRLDPAMEILVGNMELLAKRELAQLKELCKVDDEDLTDMISEIRDLNPKPGDSFGPHLMQPVIPDIFVRARPDGSWHIELNTETLPRVLVNKQYHASVSGTARSDDEKNFIADCLQNANWLVKSLDQRARTILKVGSEIIRQQDGFLAYGVQHLRPLTLKMVADAIEMHESTVSRVTTNKYMATPRGIFELKYFFTSAIQSADGGDAHSAEAVRHRIRKMINEESLDGILSDDQVVRILQAEGIDIARRTVAKYRESLRIPSSIQRRREKKQAL